MSVTDAIDDNAKPVRAIQPVAFWGTHAMTKTKLSAMTTFTVVAHPDLIDQLDACFSPSDGIQAIGELFGELPKVHCSHAGMPRRRMPRKRLDLYRGRFAWFDLGFSYVQFRNEPHVLGLWHDTDSGNPDRHEVDAVLGVTGESYVKQVDVE
jgi:hypothetical protein